MAVVGLKKRFEYEYQLNGHFLGGLVVNFVLGVYWDSLLQFSKQEKTNLTDFEKRRLEIEQKALSFFVHTVNLFTPLNEAVFLIPEEYKNGPLLVLSLTILPHKKVLSIENYGTINELEISGNKATLTSFVRN